MKCVSVVFAQPGTQLIWRLEMPDEATVREVLAAAEAQALRTGEGAQVPWDSASLGVFGESCGRGDIPRDGDRVEIYRPLLNDPKERRRQQARRR